jgi:hypothetical protein
MLIKFVPKIQYRVTTSFTLKFYLFINTKSYYVCTERHGQVVNILASHSGGPVLKSRARRPAILTEVFRSIP